MTQPAPFETPVPLRRTRHYSERAAHRHLRDDVRDFVLRHGVDIRAAGATHVVVVERQLPADVRGTEAARRARDWIIVLADDDALLTCHRRRHAVRFVRRKSGRVSGVRHAGGGAAC